ncbi:unnamed protein product [Urochloa humidicola]
MGRPPTSLRWQPTGGLGRRRPMDGHRFEDGDPFPPRQLIAVRRRLEPRPPSTSSAWSGSGTTSGWPRGHLDGSRLRHLPRVRHPVSAAPSSSLWPWPVGSLLDPFSRSNSDLLTALSREATSVHLLPLIFNAVLSLDVNGEGPGSSERPNSEPVVGASILCYCAEMVPVVSTPAG